MRFELEKYMRMRFWMIASVLLCVTSSAAAEDSLIRAPVNDYAGVIPAPVEDHVGQKLRSHYDKTGVQMAVLVVESTGETPIEDFSLDVANAWGGGRAGEDRGILLTLAIQDRRSRLEVGYGLETVVPDPLAARMLADLRPVLRQKRYDRAVRDAVDAVIAQTASMKPGQTPGAFAANPLWTPLYGFWGAILLGFLLGLIVSLLYDRDVWLFGTYPLLMGGLVILAAALGVGIATQQIAAQGYLAVFTAGLMLGFGTMALESWKRLVPAGALLIIAGVWYAYPNFFPGLGDDLDETLFISGVLTLVLAVVPFTGIRFGGFTIGAFGSSSGGFSVGGYSGGGGGFGGGGASGGW
ncbi:MAG: TPM domain-containing protein [Myxococcota bacterium]